MTKSKVRTIRIISNQLNKVVCGDNTFYFYVLEKSKLLWLGKEQNQVIKDYVQTGVVQYNLQKGKVEYTS